MIGQLVTILEESGARVKGIEIEGWGVMRAAGDPPSLWSRLGWGKQLGLEGSRSSMVETGWGECLNIRKDFRDGAKILISIQKVEKIVPGELCYIVIRCDLPGSAERGKYWENRVGGFLRSFFKERGLYFTVRGEFDRRLNPEEQLAWGREVYRYLQGRQAETVKNGRYISLLGYTPLLPVLDPPGDFRYNLNLALVNSRSWEKTQIYLGCPVITSEY